MTVNDLDIYDRSSSEWWSDDGRAFRSLRLMNEFRLQQIISHIPDLKTKKILDIGCGGGLLSIPLIELGAELTGIDQSVSSIAEALLAAHGKGFFLVGDARDIALNSASFDVVIVSDVLEHIKEYPLVLKEAARLLKPGGTLYTSTVNRTLRSYFAAILLGEGLGYVPRGTHDWRMFIKPSELRETAQTCGLIFDGQLGESPCIMKTIKSKGICVRPSESTAVSYCMFFTKTGRRL